MKKATMKQGDRVYIKCADGRPGQTQYELVEIGPNGFDCYIREISAVPGRKYALQRWDISMLFKAGPDQSDTYDYYADDLAFDAAREDRIFGKR